MFLQFNFGIVFFYIGLIQLLEYILWTTQNNMKMNYIFTKITMLINLYQPIFLALLLKMINNKIQIVNNILVCIYFITTSLYILLIWKNVDLTLEDKFSKFPTLYWKWVEQKPYTRIIGILYLITFLSLFYENFKFPLNISIQRR